MGLDDKSTSLIPEWKRGHFSLLFDGSTTPSTLLFLDHRKCRFFDLTKERKKNTAADLEVPPSQSQSGVASCTCMCMPLEELPVASAEGC